MSSSIMLAEDDFDFINENIAIGSIGVSMRGDVLEMFDCILNVGIEEVYNDLFNDEIYLHLDISDGNTPSFASRFHKALNFLKDKTTCNKRILVHCHAGISRSVSIVLGYLCDINKITTATELINIFEDLSSKRKQAFPFQGFVDYISKRHNIRSPKIGWKHDECVF